MKRKWNDIFIVPLLLMVALMLAGSVLGQLIVNGISYALGSKLDDFWLTFLTYFVNIGIWIVTCIYMWVVKRNRPILKSLGPSEKGNTVKMFIIGLIAGAIINSIAIGIAYLNGDISLYYDSFPVVKLLLIFFAVFVQSSAEELLCRGFLYKRLRMGYRNPWIAILGNALIFGALHLLNEGITLLAFLNIVLVGVAFSLVVYYFDSIWAVIAIHTAWNFNQNLVFGLPNSGYVSPVSILKLDASTARDSFAYNVGFGVEGTVSVCVIMLLACIILCIIGNRKIKAQA